MSTHTTNVPPQTGPVPPLPSPTASNGYHGQPQPTKSSGGLPHSAKKGGRSLAVIAGFLVLGFVLVGGGIAALYFAAKSWFSPQRDDLITHVVQYEPLELSVVEKGNLEAADNRDIICQVKAGGRGSNFATTIKWVIDDGSQVMFNRPDDKRKTEKGELIRGDYVWPHTYVEGIPPSRRGKPLSKEENDVLKKAAAGEPINAEDKEILDYAKKFEQHKVWSDLLVELDSAGLLDQERAQIIAVSKAAADKITAEGQVKIVRSENESALNNAQIVLDLARIDFEKYTGIDPQTSTELSDDKKFVEFARRGYEVIIAKMEAKSTNGTKKDSDDSQAEFVQLLNDIRGKIKKAEADREMINERKSWMERMLMKKYASANQAEAEQNKLLGADLDLRSLRGQESVLTGFTWRREVTDRWSKFKEAERAKTRAIIQNDAKLKTALNDDETKQKLLEKEREQLKDLREQIAHCMLFTPKDGMVVYFQSQQERSGMGSQQSSIMQGEPVREGQKIIRIPTLDQMLVSTRVHEAMVDRVKPKMRVDVRVDARPDLVLKGEVRSVATVAMPPEWRSSADVKMYLTMVTIMDSPAGMKPGMTAECTIRVDGAKGKVLTVPVQAVIGGAELGPNRKIYVRHADGRTEERDIVLGLSNEKMAEVKSGLQEGEHVVLNPKVLVGERSKTRQPGELDARNGGGSENGKAPGGKAPQTGSPIDAGPGGPTGDPSAAPKGKGKNRKGEGGGFNPDPEMKKKMDEFNDKMKKGTPQERKQMLEQIPEAFREQTKQRFEAQGLKIAD